MVKGGEPPCTPGRQVHTADLHWEVVVMPAKKRVRVTCDPLIKGATGCSISTTKVVKEKVTEWKRRDTITMNQRDGKEGQIKK